VYRIRTNDFNLDHTLSCGQVFRWEKSDRWTGIVNGAVINAKQENTELVIESSLEKHTVINYLRLDDDIGKIYDSVNRDENISFLINKYRGLRLIRQDPWECLVSYICSSNNTIRNISNSIKRMCESFGNEIEKGIYSFPEPEALADVELCDMSQCRLGFRSPRVLKIANMVANHEFDLYGIKDLPYMEGRQELVKIEGVGNKIADCVLLFAFGKLESFPVDTHIEQIMERYYGYNFRGTKSKKRDEIADFARSYFGEYCGYAQEYLYLENRE
jgi:N-glycosylase/DNA lyase